MKIFWSIAAALLLLITGASIVEGSKIETTTTVTADDASVGHIVVQSGEGWDALARRCGTTRNNLLLQNPAAKLSDIVKPGQVYHCVPGSTVPPTTTTTTTQPPVTTTIPPTTTTTSVPPITGEFRENFSGPDATTPIPFVDSSRWDVNVYTRDLRDSGQIFPTHGEHSSACGPPPANHFIDNSNDLVFLCGAGDNRHLMTAIDGGEYGQVSLSPKYTLDFSDGGVVQWDVSSLFSSSRDWWDVWIIPTNAPQTVICDNNYQDTPGFGECFIPPNGVHVRVNTWENGNPDRIGLETWVYRNGVGSLVNTETYHGIYELFNASAPRRDTYRLEISPNSINTCLPQYNFCYADNVSIPTLNWTTATVHFVHHSYNPTKDDTFPNGKAAGPGTWHWDNILIQ